MDWAREYGRVKYAYTLELRDDGEKKFLLPEDEIIETGEETWAAIKVIARRVIRDSQTPKTKTKGGSEDVPNSSQNVKATSEEQDGETEETESEADADQEEELAEGDEDDSSERA